MAQFDSACAFVLPSEGGLVDDAADPGGITNFGISLRFLKAIEPKVLAKCGVYAPIDSEAIRSLSMKQAENLYFECFWQPFNFGKIINQKLCNYIFDMAVLHGMAEAVKLVQLAICAAQKNRDALVIDGVIGPKTLQGINQSSFMLIPPLIAEREAFVRHLVSVNSHLERFKDRWLNRCYRV